VSKQAKQALHDVDRYRSFDFEQRPGLLTEELISIVETLIKTIDTLVDVQPTEVIFGFRYIDFVYTSVDKVTWYYFRVVDSFGDYSVFPRRFDTLTAQHGNRTVIQLNSASDVAMYHEALVNLFYPGREYSGQTSERVNT